MEYLDIFDENNQPTGKIGLRTEVHKNGFWHRTVHIYLIRESSGKREFLVHLRSANKDLCPNCWDVRFGGHVKAGESVEQAFSDELEEETGLTPEPSRIRIGPWSKRVKFPNREFSQIYFVRHDGEESDLRFNDGEVQAVKWMDDAEIEFSMEKEPDNWAGNRDEFREVIKSI